MEQSPAEAEARYVWALQPGQLWSPGGSCSTDAASLPLCSRLQTPSNMSAGQAPPFRKHRHQEQRQPGRGEVMLGQGHFPPRNTAHPLRAPRSPPRDVSDCSRAPALLPEQLAASEVRSDRYVWLCMFIHRENRLSRFHCEAEMRGQL